jgi:molybdopterin molybdotransferase
MGGLIEIEEARRMVLERVGRLSIEPVALGSALGRVLSEDVTSDDAVPGFDNSAMDGYAVRAADTAEATAERPVPLVLIDESRAGHPARSRLAAGTAIAISTGAMVPDGADAVVRVEDTDGSRDGAVKVGAAVEPGRNIRRAGEDIAPGERVLGSGAVLGPAEIGVLASVGRDRIACTRRPRVAVLTTGDELQEPGEAPRAGGVRNSNAHALAALVERAGAELAFAEIVRDDAAATEAALDRALAADIAIISGGVSVGEHDHVRPALERLGVEQVFWGVALRPGKPTFFGLAPRQPAAGPGRRLVFGLPGNPVSAIVTFHLFVRPAIRTMLGAESGARAGATAVLDQDYAKTKEQGSHVLTSMLGADALAILPSAQGDVRAGERVEIELLET